MKVKLPDGYQMSICYLGGQCVSMPAPSDADIKHQQQLETQAHVETMMDKQIALADKIAGPIASMYCMTVCAISAFLIVWAIVRGNARIAETNDRNKEKVRYMEIQSEERIKDRECLSDERIAELDKNSADESEEDQ